MVTTKIQVPEYLAEYITARFNNCEPGAIRFPDSLEIYHLINDLTRKRPDNHPVDAGNLEIVLPFTARGKRPETYNYISQTGTRILIRKLRTMFWTHVHSFIEDKHCRDGLEYRSAVILFMNRYCISGITEDAFIKNYYRWRKKIRNSPQIR